VVPLVLIAAWLVFGAVAVAVMRNRGHDAFTWAVLFLFLGPLALPVALTMDRHRPPDPAALAHDGALDVLVAHDGSADAAAAMGAALELIGSQLTSLTLAAVLDLEAPSTVRGRDEQRRTQERLDTVAREIAVATRAPVDSVILYGEPNAALQHFAAEHGYELIVASRDLGGRPGPALLAVAAVVFATGLSPVFTLTTDLIVGAAPPERAGSAAAISETGAEFGGALGIAVLGCIATALYRGVMIDGVPAGVPPEAAEAARATLGGALAAAQELPGDTGRALADAARGAFTRAFGWAALVSAAIVAVAAVLAATVLGPRQGAEVPATD
jgi:hypothetical protein